MYDRLSDPQLGKVVLYQLSYSRMVVKIMFGIKALGAFHLSDLNRLKNHLRFSLRSISQTARNITICIRRINIFLEHYLSRSLRSAAFSLRFSRLARSSSRRTSLLERASRSTFFWCSDGPAKNVETSFFMPGLDIQP